MDHLTASTGFAAVGSAPRLQVLQLLVRSGPKGLTVGDIQTSTGIPASTLSHHLKVLTEGGVVTQEKIGTAVRTFAAFDHLQALATYLMAECCMDMSEETEND